MPPAKLSNNFRNAPIPKPLTRMMCCNTLITTCYLPETQKGKIGAFRENLLKNMLKEEKQFLRIVLAMIVGAAALLIILFGIVN